MGLVAGRVLTINGDRRFPGEPVPEYLTDPVRRRGLVRALERGDVRRTEDEGLRAADLEGMNARDIVAGIEAGTIDPDTAEAFNEGRPNPYKTVARAVEAARTPDDDDDAVSGTESSSDSDDGQDGDVTPDGDDVAAGTDDLRD